MWLTKDHIPVVFHDDTFDRMCGVSGCIPDVNYRDLPALDPCYEQRYAIGNYSKEEALRIPTLEEVLDVIPEHVGILVELKQNDWLLVDKVHATLLQFNRRDNCVWFSLKEEINKKLAIKDPYIPRITSVPRMITVLLAFYVGCLPFIPIQERILGFAADKVDYDRVKHTAALNGFPDFVKRLLAAGKHAAANVSWMLRLVCVWALTFFLVACFVPSFCHKCFRATLLRSCSILFYFLTCDGAAWQSG